MEDVNIWILISGCVDFLAHDFNTFYISLQIALNDFVITGVQLNLKPSNSRTRIEPNRTQNWEYKNWTRTEPKFSALVKNSNWTEQNPYFC